MRLRAYSCTRLTWGIHVLAYTWVYSHTRLATNKHLLLTNDTANLESLLNQY
nr:MAG TPA: hypothetical protein [Caudoviricetes sp.]